ncbi:dihydrofolate reductase family protein [Micromonospora zamorensis]|uniref:dihydrofolate reductase family protein n=1 Tax=Micromonospora zamorensis TaxID=709883 RepID=UPI002E179109|nr:dihydrofolate reductase family protein [Micromonospora zamorensis]
MRKLINSTYITLDGVIENPMWTMPYFDEEAASLAGAQTTEADAMLMGRATYDGMSAAWPTRDESDPTTGAAYFNNVKKYVASTTLTEPTWNNTEVLQGDLVEAVSALKAQEGKNIIQYGFGSVTAQLIRAGLVDEVRFWIHPVLEGGTNLTVPLTDFKASFDLVDTRVHKSGVIVASYAPKTPA